MKTHLHTSPIVVKMSNNMHAIYFNNQLHFLMQLEYDCVSCDLRTAGNYRTLLKSPMTRHSTMLFLLAQVWFNNTVVNAVFSVSGESIFWTSDQPIMVHQLPGQTS